MATLSTITSDGGEGCFRWSLGERPISREDKFHVLSPCFRFKNVDYSIQISKLKRSSLVEISVYRQDGAPIRNLSFECEWCAENVSESLLPGVTTRDKPSDFLCCWISIREFLRRRSDWTFLGSLVLFFWLTEEPSGEFRDSEAEMDEESNEALEVDSGNENSEAEVDEESNEALEVDSGNETLQKLQRDLKKLLWSKEDSDVVFQVQDKKIPAHRNILRARSPVFEAMFKHDMAEKRSGDVLIEDSDPETFHHFLNYLYTGSTEQVTEHNVCKLFTTSDKYEVLLLKAKCAEYMKSHLSNETFCDFITVALKHSEEELLRSATEFFCENAIEIAQTPKWQMFLWQNSMFGNELFLKAMSRGIFFE